MPSSTTIAPSGMASQAPCTDTMHGMPYSRATMEAWDRIPPASATTLTRNLGAFPDTDVEKDLGKADKTFFKLVDGLFPDKFGKYFKTFPKVAEGEACAMEDMEDFF
mgnify:CR=1 FL=1